MSAKKPPLFSVNEALTDTIAQYAVGALNRESLSLGTGVLLGSPLGALAWQLFIKADMAEKIQPIVASKVIQGKDFDIVADDFNSLVLAKPVTYSIAQYIAGFITGDRMSIADYVVLGYLGAAGGSAIRYRLGIPFTPLPEPSVTP